MNQKKINSLLMISVLIFYMISYCCTPIYSLFEKVFSIFNLVFIIALVINNREKFRDKKSLFIILFLQIIQLILCKFICNTGIGSLLQMFVLTLFVMIIPFIKTEMKFYNILKYILPFFYVIFFVVNKEHLNTNYVGYIFLCMYLIGTIIYNLDRKDKLCFFVLYTIFTLILINIFRCRTAMLATVIFFILMIFPKQLYNKNSIKISLPYLLTFGSLIFAGLYVLLWKTGFKIDITFFANKSLFSGRNRIWSEAFPLLFKNPFFGLGSKYDLASFPAYALHNSIFMISLTFGIPNLIIFFYNFKQMLKKVFLSLKNNYTFKIVIVSIIILFFVDFFESYIYWSNFNFLFIFITVLSLNRNQEFNVSDSKNLDKKKLYIFEEGINRMGGVERIISTLSNRFVAKYDVKVISFYKNSSEPYFNYDKNVERIYLMNDENRYFMKYKHGTFKYYFFRILFEFKTYFLLYPKIARITSKITEEDIIIFGRVEVAIKVLPFVDNCKKIIARDAIHYLYQKKSVRRKIKRILPKYLKTLIVSSDESKDIYLENMNCHNMKITKIYNPLGIVPIKGFNYDEKTIVSIGRYARQKGFENLINAFKLVHDVKPDWKLQIVGSKHNNLVNLINDLNLGESVELVDNSRDVVSILNQSSIYVMPSRYEGYANALVEAMACGVPSITYDWLLGPNEIINDKKDGIIVKLNNRFDYADGNDNYNDIENLAQAMLSLINDKKKCQLFSERASKKIIDSRNVDLIMEKWEEVFSEL